jgi:hypothetical protein
VLITQAIASFEYGLLSLTVVVLFFSFGSHLLLRGPPHDGLISHQSTVGQNKKFIDFALSGVLILSLVVEAVLCCQ